MSDVGGIQIQPIGELVSRKAQGIVNSCLIPDFKNEPREKRCSKDIEDFRIGVSSVIRSTKRRGHLKKAQKLQSSLNKAEAAIKKRQVRKERSIFGCSSKDIEDMFKF